MLTKIMLEVKISGVQPNLRMEIVLFFYRLPLFVLWKVGYGYGHYRTYLFKDISFLQKSKNYFCGDNFDLIC
jgi:hypothetical protein